MISRAGQLSSLLTTTPLHGFRNLIINGNFDIWQRGTSQSGFGYGSADRWSVNSLAPSGALLASRQEFDIGQTAVPGNPRYYLRIAGSSFSSTELNLTQAIEGVRTLAGRKATLTFWARASAPRQLYPSLVQVFGLGGSPSSPVSTLGDPVNLTTSWQRFSQVFDLPSIAGKVLGTDGSDHLAVTLDVKRGEVGTDLGNDTIDLARVSLVEGDATAEADPFPLRHIAQELELCRRYYVRLTAPANGCRVATGFVNTETQAIFQLHGRAFRGTPAASFSNLTVQHPGGSAIVSSISEVVMIDDVLHLTVNAAGLTSGDACQLRLPSVGDYLALNAEIG